MKPNRPITNDPTKRIFLQARELPPSDQEDFVSGAAAGDQRLAARVMGLLRAELSGAATAIETPAIDLHDLRIGAEAQPGPGSLPAMDGKYTPIRLIGCGGAGDVYLCEQTRPIRRLVAVKLLRPAVVSGTGADRLRREARLLAGLDHPGIARLLDVGEAADGRPFIVMEFVDGPPIDRDCIKHETPLPERLDLFRELCDAVHHAHQRGVIHRDIKPANVLVERSGDRPRVRLVDLGVARLIDDGLSPGPSLTMAGAIVGSIGYMSPEQRRGERADTRSDVYALGVLLYCLLTGSLPPERAPADQRALAQTSPVSKPLRGELGAIIARAMAPRPDDRYETVRELDEDIRRHLNHEPIRARGPGALYTAAKFIRRHWAASIAATVALATALTALVLINTSRIETILAHNEAEAQYAEARRISNFFLRDVVTRLYRVPGAQEIQLDLLNELLRQTEDFLQSRPDEPALLDDYAETLYALGDVLIITPGGRETAEDYLLRALDVRLQLVERQPDNPDYLMKLGVAYARRGDLMRPASVADWYSPQITAGMLGYYYKALDIDRRLVAIDPESRRYRDNLYWSYDRIAGVLRRTGNPDALRWAEEAMGVAAELNRRHPDHYLTAFALSKAHITLGGILFQEGEHERAEPHFELAAEHGERLNALYPNSWYFLRHLNHVYRDIHWYADAIGDHERSQAALKRRVDIAESLDASDPSRRWSTELVAVRAALERFNEERPADQGVRNAAGDPD